MFFSPKQVAESLGVSGSTVRRYAATYGDLLSPYANPERGRRRSFTEADVDLLRQMQSLLAAGLSERDMRAQLVTYQSAAAVLREAADVSYGASVEQVLAALADQKPLLEAQARMIAELGERVGRLEARLERLSQQAIREGR